MSCHEWKLFGYVNCLPFFWGKGRKFAKNMLIRPRGNWCGNCETIYLWLSQLLSAGQSISLLWIEINLNCGLIRNLLMSLMTWGGASSIIDICCVPMLSEGTLKLSFFLNFCHKPRFQIKMCSSGRMMLKCKDVNHTPWLRNNIFSLRLRWITIDCSPLFC